MNVPEVPLVDPVWLLAAVMVIFALVPPVSERFKLPGIVGLILVGALIGEHGMAILSRPGAIELLGTGGLLFIMFLVGLELDLDGFRNNKRTSISFGVMSYAVPQVIGTVACLGLGTDLDYAILAGAIFGSHTVVAYPIASRLGILHQPAVTCALGGTVITNILTLTALALIVALAGGGSAATLAVFGASLTVYVVTAAVVLPKLANLLLANATATAGAASVLAVLFAFGALGQFLKIQPIIGVMLAGLAFNHTVRSRPDVLASLRNVGDLLLVPFFLLSLGMLVDFSILADTVTASIAVGIAVLVALSKWIAAFITQKSFGFNAAEGWVLFGLTGPHAAATSAIALVGREIGIFDDYAVTTAVIVILVTSICGAIATERAGRALIRSNPSP